MSSASKTLELLHFFTPDRPEIGLSQLCRVADRDKATTYRHLQALEEAGLVEQNPVTKRYRLGPALLQLAQTRELTVPRKAGVEGPLQDLANATGETSHASVLSGKVLYRLQVCESPAHSIRVTIDIQTFPLHATASGLCVLAFGSDGFFEYAKGNLRAFTKSTMTSINGLEDAIADIRKSGFSKSDGGYESDVLSISAPLFDQTGFFAGAVTVACVAARFTSKLEHTIKTHLVLASRDISRNWGGVIPANIEHAWAVALAQPHGMEPA